MKRRNFLGFLAGAAVAAREAFVGDVEAEELPESAKPLRESIKKLGDAVTLNGHPYRVSKLTWHLTERIPENDIAIAIHYELKAQGKVSISDGTQRDS